LTARAAPGGDSPLLGFLLRDALRLMRADFSRRTTGLGLTPALYRLLFHLDREPGCRQVELAGVMEITPVTVGRMIDRLEKQRLVRRASHPDDRRATCVFLDRRGTELMERLREIARQTEGRALQDFGARERDALYRDLRRLRDNLSPSTSAGRKGGARGR
jgi:MarR family transcriptional regulator for hemolysin